MNKLDQSLPSHIKALLQPDLYDHEVKKLQLIQTHISWVVLTGPFAYKIKKPINLGFLDFTTLEQRLFYCSEEMRLNKRFAPQLYLDVVAISERDDTVSFSDSNHIVDYAIKMHQFEQHQQLDKMLDAGLLQHHHIVQLAKNIVEFHQQCPIAYAATSYGKAQSVLHPMQENFRHLHQLVSDQKSLHLVKQIECWYKNQIITLTPLFEARKQQGFIRECHGDLHSRNLVVLNDNIVAFDCIEFSKELRWIDVFSDIAFVIMDLDFRQQTHFSTRLLNNYLEETGDYFGLSVLRFYLVYRSMVRAKVEAISANQNKYDSIGKACHQYLDLASHYTESKTPTLIITYGLSASGKSTLSKQLSESLSGIIIRSDVERKRLFGKISNGLYSQESIQQTYQYLLKQSEMIINCGYSLIVDATFLAYKHRQQFLHIAEKLNVTFIILNLKVSAEILRQRIQNREQDVSDADLTVLEHQIQNRDALKITEQSYVIDVDITVMPKIDELLFEINAHYLSHS